MYAAKKYCGGVYCGCGEFDSLDAVMEFADDGFCDYVRVTNLVTEQVLKIHFTPDDNKLFAERGSNY